MLDTGADRNWIDSQLAAELILPLGKEADVTLTDSVGNSRPTAVARVCVRGGLHQEGEFLLGDFRGSGCDYEVLLGMDFLEYHSFTVNAFSGIHRLTYLGTKPRR